VRKFLNQQNQSRKGQRRPVSEKYIDSEGKEQIRGSSTDFETLACRVSGAILDIPGVEQDKELREWIGYAAAYYDTGEYEKALHYLTQSLMIEHALEPYFFYYMRVCKRVLAVPPRRDEVLYEAKLVRYRALPRWLRWTMPRFEFRVRCKWCGRYTQYIDPNVPTFGFSTFANSCMSCGRMYPMPFWMWDSPDGWAYSYYRMSFSDEKFYEEFERDYDPKPLCQHRRK